MMIHFDLLTAQMPDWASYIPEATRNKFDPSSGCVPCHLSAVIPPGERDVRVHSYLKQGGLTRGYLNEAQVENGKSGYLYLYISPYISGCPGASPQ